MEDKVGTSREAFLSRQITVKWTLILLIVVILAGAYLWGSKALECRRIASRAADTLEKLTSQSADDLARAVSIFANRPIVTKDWAQVQQYADELVSIRTISYLAVVDMKGTAVVHTDRSSLGKKLAEPEDESAVHASVPVMSSTEQVATVRVGVRPAQW